jgi:DNA-binding NtrC family response regulator
LDHGVIDVELFGSEPGAFTGATRHPGAFEETENGTLVLDDIDCLPLDKQRRLLQPIEQRIVRRLGGARDVQVRCRILATTNKSLSALVKKGEFLEDLLSRLEGAPVIRVPGLENRSEDVDGLVCLFASEAAQKDGWRPPEIQSEFLEAVKKRRWASVRHLSRAVEYAVGTSGGFLTPSALPEHAVPSEPNAPSGAESRGTAGEKQFGASPEDLLAGTLKEVVGRIRLLAVRRALAAASGDKQAAAAHLGITVQWLNAVLRDGDGPQRGE